MTFLPICAHRQTITSRLVDGQPRSRCMNCGVEFALIFDKPKLMVVKLGS